MSAECICMQDNLYKSLSRNITRYNYLESLNSDDELVKKEMDFIKENLSEYTEEDFSAYGLENPIKKDTIQSKSVGLLRKLFPKT